MTARAWSREELDRVHPLPEGWAWGQRGYNGWMAVFTNHDGDAGRGDWHVWVDETDDITSWFFYYPGSPGRDEAYDPPIDVALAVILASKGLDSFGAMADAIDELAADDEADMREPGPAFALDIGGVSNLREAAAMLRRGRVYP